MDSFFVEEFVSIVVVVVVVFAVLENSGDVEIAVPLELDDDIHFYDVNHLLGFGPMIVIVMMMIMVVAIVEAASIVCVPFHPMTVFAVDYSFDLQPSIQLLSHYHQHHRRHYHSLVLFVYIVDYDDDDDDDDYHDGMIIHLEFLLIAIYPHSQQHYSHHS